MKLFVTDIDDTLSVGERVSQEVEDACARLKNGGWEIMIATGRTFGTAKTHIAAASATQPAILYDGARLMSVEGKEIRSFLFDPSLAAKLVDFLWTLPAEIQIAGDEIVHCRESDVETARFYREAGMPVFYIETPVVPGPVYRMGLWLKPENLSFVESQVEAAFGDCAEVVSGGAEYVDILPKGVSKGSALEYYISTLPRRPEVVVAAGDHKNDMTLLRCADVAVIPANAAQVLLPLADVIMPKAAENGISALARHILSPDFQFFPKNHFFPENHPSGQPGKSGRPKPPVIL
ncbi:MAG: Cof-type HAD-IIB family hydrolase [Synergistaceae bacterium]|jgi:Cof subfamily protein (haloacid dehalogenase superfamily)|nr:Cof-type HAD-IIB family hydrolase [Synergistaceae bacterium]